MAFDQSDDMAVVCAAQQIALPMTWHSAIFNGCRSLSDGNSVEDMADLLGCMPRATDRPARAQMLQQLLFQDAARLHVKAAIDGFVRHLGRLVSRARPFQPACDLLG